MARRLKEGILDGFPRWSLLLHTIDPIKPLARAVELTGPSLGIIFWGEIPLESASLSLVSMTD